MRINNLSIYNYRNIQELSFDCNETTNCLIGKNGVGKTNILDAIYYLSFCKSSLISNDALNVRHSEKSFFLQGLYEVNGDASLKISCAYNQAEKTKVFKCNDKKYVRFSDHIGLLPVVFVSPADIALINEGSAERRRFLDLFISMYNKEYFSQLVVYNKLLQQRNSLLKQDQPVDDTYLSVLDEKLSILGRTIYEERKKSVEVLSSRTKTFYSEISSSEECAVHYDSQLEKGDMYALLEKNREKDKCLTYTSVGIHRDDLHFSFDGNLIKNIASQGQKKSFLLALKFAQYQLIAEKKGEKPLLLLDDLFDKLDKERAKNIFDIVEKQDFGQIFITDTDKILLHTIFEQRKERGTFWMVENGTVQQIRE